MKVTEEIIQQIKDAMDHRTTNGRKVMNHGELSDLLGFHKSWATRFLKGHIESLSRENAIKIEKALDIRFISNELKLDGYYCSTALAAAEMAERDPHFRKIVEAYHLATKGENTWQVHLEKLENSIDRGPALKVAQDTPEYNITRLPCDTALIEEISHQAILEAKEQLLKSRKSDSK